MLKEERNSELLKYIQCKLNKKNDRIGKITEWLYDKDEIGGTLGETLTLGTSENLNAIGVSSLATGAGVAIGLASTLLGILVIFPTIGGPINEEEAIAFKDLTTIGENIFNFSGSSLVTSLKAAVIPLGITAISLPKKFLRVITDKVEKKAEPIVVENEKIIELIEDYTQDKDDPSIEFFKIFAKRVSLKDNSDEYNLELLKRFVHYRECLQEYEKANKREKNEKSVALSYMSIINCIREGIDSPKTSDEFKNSRFTRLIASDYDVEEKYYEKGFRR